VNDPGNYLTRHRPHPRTAEELVGRQKAGAREALRIGAVSAGPE